MAKFKGVWCPSCGCEMRKRRGKYGEFYGCMGYPLCKNTMNLRDAALAEEEHENEGVDIDMDEVPY